MSVEVGQTPRDVFRGPHIGPVTGATRQVPRLRGVVLRVTVSITVVCPDAPGVVTALRPSPPFGLAVPGRHVATTGPRRVGRGRLAVPVLALVALKGGVTVDALVVGRDTPDDVVEVGRRGLLGGARPSLGPPASAVRARPSRPPASTTLVARLGVGVMPALAQTPHSPYCRL